MKCEELLNALDVYLDGETQSALCQALQEHLADCHSCRLVIDNIRQTIGSIGLARRSLYPRALHESLCAIMRERWAAQCDKNVLESKGKQK